MTNQFLRRSSTAIAVAIGLGLAAGGAQAAPVTFSTFISGADINAVLGQNNTIAITYAGDKFVGSVYVGPNNLQLYQSDLNGQNVQKFGSLLPTGGGEPVLAASLGQAGFPSASIYSSGGDGKIYMYGHNGGAPVLFGSTDDGSNVRQIFFDPGSSFGGKMLVATTSGHILSYSSTGARTLVASVGEDTEGMDVASKKYGKYAGQLLVASEGSGKIRAIKADGTITVLNLRNQAGAVVAISAAETVSTVPLDLGVSGDPLEGFYVGNYPADVQKAAASAFAGLEGDTLITSEFGGNSTLWDLSYNGDVTDTFTVSPVGTIPNQSEDGIFVTKTRIAQTNPVPEPISLVLVSVALGALRLTSFRRTRAGAV